MENINNCVTNNEVCNYHNANDSVIGDMKEAVKALVAGQVEMRLSITQLVEAFKSMDRLEAKIDKLEARQIINDKDQDEKIQELRNFMYKCLGAGSAILTIGGFLLKFI